MNPWLQLALAAIPGAVAAGFAYYASTRTARMQAQATQSVAELNAATERTRLDVERQKLAEEAIREAKATYASLIADLRAELERVHTQIERVQSQADRFGDQLLREQGVSGALRETVANQNLELDRLRRQVETLETLVSRFRGHAIGPAPAVEI